MSLGESYVEKFKLGDYVMWRSLSSDVDLYYEEFNGIIVGFKNVTEKQRTIYYATILENKSGDTIYVLLSSLIKIKTN